MEGGQGGEMEGGTREQCGSNCIGSVFGLPYNWSDLAGEEGGGWGEAWGGEGGQGGRWAGAIREQCGSNKRCTGFPVLGSLKNLTTGLIWLVTRVGAWGEAWGGGPWRAGKGGDGGGGTRAVWENKRCTGSPFWAPLKTYQLV